MNHFATCIEYETEIETNWRDLKLNQITRQKDIGKMIQKKEVLEKVVLKKLEDGQASSTSGFTCSNV